MSMKKELEEELITLRSDINKYKKMGWEYHLEDTLVRFSEIETELEELHHE